MNYTDYKAGKIKPYPRPSPTTEQLAWFTGQFRPHFDTMVVSPATELVNHTTSGAMPAFLWITCAIDWLAGFMYGEDRELRNAVRESYTNFVSAYFVSNPKYKEQAENLYIFRNGLIHNYSIKQNKGSKKRDYALTHNSIDGQHFDVLSNGQTLLNLNDFLNDFILAKDKYFNDVEKKSKCFYDFAKCYEREGFLQTY